MLMLLFAWQLHRWPAIDSPGRSQAEENAIQQYHLPAFKRFLASPSNFAFIVSDRATKQCIGLAGWRAPQTSDLRRKQSSYERLSAFAFRVQDALSSTSLFQWLHRLLYPQAAALTAKMKRWVSMEIASHQHINPNHGKDWNLTILGVLPSHARQGIASRLLQWGIDKADEEDKAIYLNSSPPGVGLYQKHGFKVLRRVTVFADEDRGGFEDCAMCRPPKSEQYVVET